MFEMMGGLPNCELRYLSFFPREIRRIGFTRTNHDRTWPVCPMYSNNTSIFLLEWQNQAMSHSVALALRIETRRCEGRGDVKKRRSFVQSNDPLMHG
jgi:hypothetical protein